MRANIKGPPASALSRRRGDGRLVARLLAVAAVWLGLILLQPQRAAAAANAGDLDLTFHGQGWTAVPLPVKSGVVNFAAQKDGRIVASGVAGPAGAQYLTVHRLLAEGLLDLSFNGTGSAATTAQEGVYTSVWGVPQIAVQQDGKILLSTLITSDGILKVVLYRFLTDGAADTAFGEEGTGAVTLRVSTGSPPDGLVVQSDGGIVLSGASKVWRFDPSGIRDLTYAPAFGGVLRLQPDGKLLAGSGGVDKLTLRRYLPDGTADETFGGSGRVTLPMPQPGWVENEMQIEVLPDGRLWIGGALRRNGAGVFDDLLLVRLHPDGSPDTSFNSTGVAIYENRTTSDFLGIMPQYNGSIIFAYLWENRLSMDYRRADGTLDTRFGSNGRVIEMPAASNDYWRDVVLLPDADLHILAAGARYIPAGDTFSLLLRRYVNLLEIAPVVEYPAGTALENAPAQPVDFGAVPVGAQVREFTLRNDGWKPLANLAVSMANESHPGEFTVTPPAVATLARGEHTTFVVTLTLQGSFSARSATLRVTGRNGDGAEELLLFSTPVTGRRATPSEVWRYTWFGTTDNTGPAADLTDFDNDGLVNLLEYALGGDPHQTTSPSPQAAAVVRNGPVLEFSYIRAGAALTEVNYTPEAAASPAGPWSTVGLTSAVVSESGGMQTVAVTVPLAENTGARFVRLRVSRR